MPQSVVHAAALGVSGNYLSTDASWTALYHRSQTTLVIRNKYDKVHKRSKEAYNCLQKEVTPNAYRVS